MKTNGITYKAFINDESYWGANTYYDDVLVWVNGVELGGDKSIEDIPDDADIKIESGYIMMHDKKPDGTSLESFFRAWLKIQSTVRKVVAVPKEKEEEFKNLMKQHGFKIC